MNKIREIQTIEDWDRIKKSSAEKEVLLLKHSTACLTSLRAYHHFKAIPEMIKRDLDFYLLTVIEHRKVSNKIEADLDVVHESPQIILVKNQMAIWKASHWSISTKNVVKVLNSIIES